MKNKAGSITNKEVDRPAMDSDDSTDIILPKFVTAHRYTPILGRYCVSEYIYNLHPDIVITNTLTGKQSPIKELITPRETLKLQTLDFCGTVGLVSDGNELNIRPSINELVHTHKFYSLIHHQMHFINFILREDFHAALVELKYIGLWAQKSRNKTDIFNHKLARGYISNLMGEKEVAKEFFSDAYDYLNTEMNITQTEEMSNLLVNRHLRSVSNHFNWNDILNGMIFSGFDASNFDILEELSLKAGINDIDVEEPETIAGMLGITPIIQIPGRFVVRLYINEVHPFTIVRNLSTGENHTLTELLNHLNTMRVQTLDYVGVITLEVEDNGESKVVTAINELFYDLKFDSLLAHELNFCIFMSQFNSQAALVELDRIEKLTHNKSTRRDKLCFMAARARALLRIRNRSARLQALELFENTIEFLYTNFTADEIEAITLENARKYRDTDTHNWDSFLYDYHVISILEYYVSTAVVLGFFAVDNEYGLLLDELIDRANLYQMDNHVISLLEAKAHLLHSSGHTESAIEHYEVICQKILEIDNVSSNLTIMTTFWDATRWINNLYLNSNNSKKSKDLFDKIKAKFDFEETPHSKLYYLLAVMEQKNIEGNIAGSIDIGKEIFSLVKRLDGRINRVSPIFYIYPMFQLLVQLSYLDQEEETELFNSIIDNVFLKNDRIMDCRILLQLLEIYRSQQTLNRDTPNLDVLDNILMSYWELIDNIETSPLYSQKKVIVHYLDFALSYMMHLPQLQQDLLDRSAFFTELLLDSTNILLTIKCNSINLVLSNKLQELKDWLQEVEKHYDLTLIRGISHKIDQISEIEDVGVTRDRLLELVGYDILHNQYTMHEAPSLIEIRPLIRSFNREPPKKSEASHPISNDSLELLKLLSKKRLKSETNQSLGLLDRLRRSHDKDEDK
ncbi:MAG: hypothetical protein ACW99Q_00895 [Candidatus Kariarchaeaceae archaeon]|jgi:hypothetical protein